MLTDIHGFTILRVTSWGRGVNRVYLLLSWCSSLFIICLPHTVSEDQAETNVGLKRKKHHIAFSLSPRKVLSWRGKRGCTYLSSSYSGHNEKTLHGIWGQNTYQCNKLMLPLVNFFSDIIYICLVQDMGNWDSGYLSL